MKGEYENAVRTSDGEVESFFLKIGGVNWRCECGSNCLHKPDKENLNLFKCNGCGLEFEAI